MSKKKTLIIGGVHKAGTTSLFTYLSWHPEICASDIKETHFFSDSTYSKKFDSYLAYFKTLNNKHQYILEASPEYFYGKQETINRIIANLEGPKFIFLLRDPADKILSSFNHRKKLLSFPKQYPFSQFKKEHLSCNSLEEIDQTNIYRRELLEGSYIDYLPVWYDNFNSNDIKIIFFDDLKNNPSRVVCEVSEWLGIEAAHLQNKAFTIENKSVEVKNRFLQKIAIYIVKRTEPFLRRNFEIKKKLRDIYYKINVKDIEEQDSLSLIEIDKLYESKNRELKNYLFKKGYTDFPKWLKYD